MRNESLGCRHDGALLCERRRIAQHRSLVYECGARGFCAVSEHPGVARMVEFDDRGERTCAADSNLRSGFKFKQS